tara:strand:- start:296 stop:544 length:249 start_codon:yes stop_codon:yes gene_type:complete
MTEVRFDKNPDAVFLGDLTRNRVAYDHNGKKLKVEFVGTGSVTVNRAGQPRMIKDRVFAPRERTTLSKLMVVYLRKPEVTNG